MDERNFNAPLWSRCRQCFHPEPCWQAPSTNSIPPADDEDPLDLSIKKAPKTAPPVPHEEIYNRSLGAPSTAQVTSSVLSPRSAVPEFPRCSRNLSSINTGIYTPELLARYEESLRHMRADRNQNNSTTTNENMRRTIMSANNERNADPQYLHKRKKNNEAAKRSRDTKKAKEDELALRVRFLEEDYRRLVCDNEALKAEKAVLLESRRF